MSEIDDAWQDRGNTWRFLGHLNLKLAEINTKLTFKKNQWRPTVDMQLHSDFMCEFYLFS